MNNINTKGAYMKYILFLLYFILLMGSASATTPPIVYVNTDGSGDYDCDGTDDHVQINQALAFVGSNAGYSTVHLNGSNTYWINLTLNMYEGTIFEGDSNAEIKLVADASWAAYVPMISNTTTGSTNFTIQNFIIDGNSESKAESRGAGYYNMMYFENCYNITVDNMTLEWGLGDGLKVQHTSGAQDSAYVTFTNNSVYKLGHDALYVTRLNNVIAANNDVFTRTNTAFRLSNSGQGEIYNNTIHSEFAGWSTGPGIELDTGATYTSENIEIYNNTFHTLNGAGIWLSGRTEDDVIRTKDVHIHHNIFYDVGQYWSDTGYGNAAITIGQFNNTIIENNVIDSGGHAGIKYNIRPTEYHMNVQFTTTVRNNIIINTDGQTTTPPGPGAGIWNYNDTLHTFISKYNCIYNNSDGAYNGTNITYSNDIYVAPLFYNESNHEYYLNSTTGTWNGTDWELMNSYSPCIDGGKPSSDYSNEPAPNGDRINIGAYGDTIYASKSQSGSQIPDPIDNRLKESTPDTVFNDTSFIDVGIIDGIGRYRGVLLFNLSSYNTTDIIDSATLSLFWYYEERNQSTNVSIYRPLEWHEDFVTWNSNTSGVSWNTAGGDWYDKSGILHGNVPYTNVTFTGSPDNVYHDFNVTDLVQSYTNGSQTNTGFFIKSNELADDYIAFHSQEYSNVSRRPILTIIHSNYTQTIFISPTLANNSITADDYVEINASTEIFESLTEYIWNWNGTNTTFLNDSCVLHMSFDNNSAIGDNSTLVVDVSQYGNNGSFTDGTSGNWTTNGKYNGAMSFNGSDLITQNNGQNINGDQLSIMGWVNPSLITGDDRIIKYKTGGYYFQIDSSGKLETYLYDTTAPGYHQMTTTIPLNSYTFVAVTYNGTNVTLYKNDSYEMFATTGNIVSTTVEFVGGSVGERYFVGEIDELREYHYCFSHDEIEQFRLSNLYKYNSTYWYFWSNQTDLSEGEYNYQIFANDVSSDYRVVTFGQIYNISGIITDNNGGTLTGVTVSDNESVDSNVSYGAGIFNLTGYLNNTYNLTFSKSGFDTGYLEVTISGAANTTANKQIFDNTPPGQVIGLTEDSKNTTTINISWNAVSGADSYQIFRNTSHIAYITNLYYNDTGLTANTNYGYEVRANDTYDNWGTNSSELVVTTDVVTSIVSGTVYGGDNIGLQNVSMTLGTYSTTTAADGTFLFTGILDGSYTLTSYIDGYDTLSKTVTVSGADVTGQDFYYDIIVDRGGGGGSSGFISIMEVLDKDGEVIGKAIAIGKPGETWFTIDFVSILRLLSGEDSKNTWSFIGILSIISILTGLFDTSKTARPEFLLIVGFVGMGLYAIYQSKLAVVIGFG